MSGVNPSVETVAISTLARLMSFPTQNNLSPSPWSPACCKCGNRLCLSHGIPSKTPAESPYEFNRISTSSSNPFTLIHVHSRPKSCLSQYRSKPIFILLSSPRPWPFTPQICVKSVWNLWPNVCPPTACRVLPSSRPAPAVTESTCYYKVLAVQLEAWSNVCARSCSSSGALRWAG
jgi:hypothetical protein